MNPNEVPRVRRDHTVFDSPDYAALEMRVMAVLMNNKESE